MHSTRSNGAVTFAVDDVTPADTLLDTCKPLDAVRTLLDAPSSLFAPDESSQGNPTHGRVEACWNYSLDCVANVWHHPLVGAAHLAFSQHRPLVLSPDVVWLTIAQGLAQHVRLDPEKHRSLLVRHEGKATLTVERDDLHRGSPENPWDAVVGEFASLVRREVGEFAERLVCDFSTTGPVERVVSEVVLLDLFEPYFCYHAVAACGIPSITLEGTPTDWRTLRDKVDLLEPFGLDWWTSELRPICDQFVRASEGDVDLDHWRRIYKIRAVYAATMINGWLGKLFPYTSGSSRNPLLDPEVESAIQKLEAEEAQGKHRDRLRSFSAPGVRPEDLPRGMSQVPFALSEETGKRAMEFVAGSLAVTQDEETHALRPTLGWAVRESAPIEQALLQLEDHELELGETDLSWELFRSLDLSYIPTDVLRFYQVASSAKLHGGLYRVLPLEEWGEPEWVRRWRPCPEGEPYQLPAELYRFAELSDGTELVIQLYCRDREKTGSVTVGHRDGEAVAETGRKVAKSFTDFLQRALAEGDEPYFRHDGFEFLDER